MLELLNTLAIALALSTQPSTPFDTARAKLTPGMSPATWYATLNEAEREAVALDYFERSAPNH